MANVTISTESVPEGFWQFPGSTCELRIAANQSFRNSDGQLIPRGLVSKPNTCLVIKTCTVNADLSVTIPEVTELFTTDDSIDLPTATYTAALFPRRSSQRQVWPDEVVATGFAIYTYLTEDEPATTWARIVLSNLGAPLINPPDTWWTSEEVIRYVRTVQTAKATTSIYGTSRLDKAATDPSAPIVVSSTSVRVPALVGPRYVYANQYSGDDVGAKINAADADLGSDGGVIVYLGGGLMSVQAILSQKHTLRLGAGTYTPTTSGCPILQKEDTTIHGDGFQTIIKETSAPIDGSGNQFNVIAMYGQYFSNGTTTRNIVIRDLQILGNRSDFNSAAPTIGLGNCHGGLVENVYLNGTHSIGINAGGSSTTGSDPLGLGRYAENVTVKACVLNRVASQNLSCVNGKSITFDGNQFLNPSQTGGPGVTVIDCEINAPLTDKMEGILIINNILDARNSEISPHGNFIAYQPGSVYTGPSRISGNIAFSAFHTSNGVVLATNSKNVEVSNNFLSGMGQNGLALQGTLLTVDGNTLRDTGTGGTDSMALVGVTYSRISNNHLYSPTLGLDNIVESVGADYNYYIGNTLGSPGINIVGANSRRDSNIDYTTGVMRSDNFTLGNGTNLTKVLRGSVTIDPASINATTVSSQTFTLSGALAGDSLTLNTPTAGLTAGLLVQQAFVSASNQVTIVFYNSTGAPIDQASASWTYQLTR